MWLSIAGMIHSFFTGLFEKISILLYWISAFLRIQVIDIGGDPLTVGEITLAIVITAFGIFFIRKMSSHVESKVLSHFDIEPAFRYTIKTFVSYFLILILALFVLRLLNIPVTVITAVGAAFAFALGLGAQNIVYDFLSGLIMILEHPVRKRDLIEVDNITARVEHVGARATRLLTLDNKHLIVPNNYFLSKTILNWTLSDEVIRSEVKVGVTYGSSTEQVAELMSQAAAEHPEVRKDPAPRVIFDDFGDDALIFRLSFYSRVNNIIDLRRIRSDLRFMLSKVFKQNGIIIAYPQRDIHFKDDSHPIKVQIISETEKN